MCVYYISVFIIFAVFVLQYLYTIYYIYVIIYRDFISSSVVAVEMDLEEARGTSNAHFVETRAATGNGGVMSAIMELSGGGGAGSQSQLNSNSYIAEGGSSSQSQTNSQAVLGILEEILK